ncbi:tetratricopeptide repeat protein [Trinickia sp.]|jgi:TPR repeat protein|uniref:tetratricopeptide repeat protein n=1 Tax=Trinickia sp. TaxID=2571163 RepID=UPI0039C988B8
MSAWGRSALPIISALTLAVAGLAGAAPAQSRTQAEGQINPAAPLADKDPETQAAVADYNAGDFNAALKEFRDAAERGNRLAQFNYAMMLLNGEGTPANVDEGRKWLRKAADANMSHAQYVYGRMYDDGDFVSRDPTEAHRWFIKAAQQGHIQAELALANQFLDGRGTARDYRQAFHWYKKAAEGGDMTAQYVTASFYERGGDGVTRNINIARAYYAAAAAQGDPAARLKFQELSSELSREAQGQSKPAQP